MLVFWVRFTLCQLALDLSRQRQYGKDYWTWRTQLYAAATLVASAAWSFMKAVGSLFPQYSVLIIAEGVMFVMLTLLYVLPFGAGILIPSSVAVVIAMVTFVVMFFK